MSDLYPLALPWRNKIEVYNAGLKYVSDRKTGKVKSLKCKSFKLNDASCDGFEFGTAWCFAARPGGGKSLLKEQLIEEFFQINTDMNFRALDWDLEMPAIQTAIRKFSSVLGKSYKYLCSAEADEFNQKMTKKEFDELRKYVALKKNFKGQMINEPFDVIEEAPTVKQFEQTCIKYMEDHATGGVEMKDGVEVPVKIYTQTVITLDHARLILKEGKSELDMLYELSPAIIRLKKKFPIIFIIFNHLNREVTKADRCDNGKIANYIVDNDILGADALNQCCDLLIAMDRPFKRKIQYYGPERYIVNDPYILIFHFLKVRNGDTRISFFKGEFDKMRIVEEETPPCARDMAKLRS